MRCRVVDALWDELRGEDGRHPPHTRLDPVAAHEAMEQMIALGYIERPDEKREVAVEKTIREANSQIAMRFTTMNGLVSDSIGAQSFRTALASGFAILSLLLALSGMYAVVGSTIFSVFSCDASGYRGAEQLGQIDAHHYATAGLLLQNDKLIYSWQMRLTRET